MRLQYTGLLVNSPSDFLGLRANWSSVILPSKTLVLEAVCLLDVQVAVVLHEKFHLDVIFPFREALCGQ